MANEGAVATETPGSTTGADATPAPKQDTQQSQQGTPTGATVAGTTKFEYAEDRSKWVPPHRVSEETRKRQDAERRYTESQTRLEAETKRVQALAGLQPKSAEETNVEQVRAALTAIFPGLERLSDKEFLQRLDSVSQRDGELQQAVEAHWTQHGRVMLDAIEETVADALGGDLTDRQKARLAQAYINEIKDDPALVKRHEQGDRSLVDQFAKDFLDDWYKPAQRQVTNQQVGRVVSRRTPNGRESRPVVQGKPQIDYNNPKAVEDAMVQAFKDHGGEFGRR